MCLIIDWLRRFEEKSSYLPRWKTSQAYLLFGTLAQSASNGIPRNVNHNLEDIPTIVKGRKLDAP